MKIKRTVVAPPKPVDITELFIEFSEKYRNVFVYQIEENVFIYRALGRREYKDILLNEDFTDLEKEELICRQCLLYPSPDDFDWDNCDAGLPTQLRKNILENSYLDSLESRDILKNYYRMEMYDLDNQISCIINEAFPYLDIEEIEKWDVEKTMKYLTRAEWTLHNLRGIPFREPQGGFINGSNGKNIPDDTEKESQEKEEKKSTIRGGSREAKLTPERIEDKNGMSYEEFRRKFPQFAHDSVMEKGADLAFSTAPTVDTKSYALRTPED